MTRDRTAASIARKDLRNALRHWHDSAQLGRSPLANLPAAEAALRSGGYSQSEVGRGLALRTALWRASEELAQIPGRKGERWCAVIRGLYVDGRSPESLMDSLAMARSTFDHEHAAAVDAIGRALESTGALTPFPAALMPPVPRMAPELPTHPLVGRDELLAGLRSRLLGGAPISAALHGPPGSGKTTLAASLAADAGVLDRFPDGVLWLGLGEKPDLGAKLGAWAENLGVPWAEIARRTRPEDRAQLVRSAIGDRRMLLVVDDLWDLAHVRALAVAGPTCGQLFTTRNPSLATELSPATPIGLPELEVDDGLQLLGYFVPTLPAQDRELARSLVESMGGLPLALVLVGRRLQQEAMLGSAGRIHQLLVEMMDPGRRLQPESPIPSPDMRSVFRPLSLHSAIELSVSAFDDIVRAGFHALGALPPGPATFDDSAAMAVSHLSSDGLTQLVLAGLVEAVARGRYRMHSAIHDYCRARRLGPQVHQRLLAHVRERLDRRPIPPSELERDLPVLQAALEAAQRQGSPDDFADLTLALLNTVEQAGAWAFAEPHWTRAEGWAREALDQERLLALQAARAQAALHLAAFTDAECFAMEGLMLALELDDVRQAARMFKVLGAVAFNRGDHTAAEASYQNGLRQVEAEGFDSERCSLQTHLARVYLIRREFHAARSLLDQALLLSRRLGDVRKEASILRNLGVAAAELGDHARARLAFEEGLELSQAMGSWEQRMSLLVSLGALVSDEGEFDRARALFEEALILARQLGDRLSLCLVLGNLGATLTQQDDLEAAVTLLDEGVALARATGHPEAQSLVLTHAGGLDHRLGSLEQAEERLTEALRLADQTGQPRLQAGARCGLANVRVDQHRPADAADLFRNCLELASASGPRAIQAEAEFGLAKIEWAEGKKASARRRVSRSLKLIGDSHPLAREADTWLRSHAASAVGTKGKGSRATRGKLRT